MAANYTSEDRMLFNAFLSLVLRLRNAADAVDECRGTRHEGTARRSYRLTADELAKCVMERKLTDEEFDLLVKGEMPQWTPTTPGT